VNRLRQQEAREKLCSTYWPPIYGFVRRQGAGSEEAKDLTQGFFALLLERRDLNTVRKEKGRLRSYLKAAAAQGKDGGQSVKRCVIRRAKPPIQGRFRAARQQS